MKLNATVLIIVGVIALLVVYLINQQRQRELALRQMETQVALIDAQTRQQQACSDNWLCATQTLLTGAGDVLGGVGSIFDFGGSDNA